MNFGAINKIRYKCGFSYWKIYCTIIVKPSKEEHVEQEIPQNVEHSCLEQ